VAAIIITLHIYGAELRELFCSLFLVGVYGFDVVGNFMYQVRGSDAEPSAPSPDFVTIKKVRGQV